MLGRRLGVYQWLSLLILMAGVALVQVQYNFKSLICFSVVTLYSGYIRVRILWNILIIRLNCNFILNARKAPMCAVIQRLI